jgi:hypothetical protein
VNITKFIIPIPSQASLFLHTVDYDVGFNHYRLSVSAIRNYNADAGVGYSEHVLTPVVRGCLGLSPGG